MLLPLSSSQLSHFQCRRRSNPDSSSPPPTPNRLHRLLWTGGELILRAVPSICASSKLEAATPDLPRLPSGLADFSFAFLPVLRRWRPRLRRWDALSSTLSSQSASSKFHKTSSSASSSSSASVFGLFQCRGDLSGSDCAACVSRAMSSWSGVCGASVAARVQLAGCLALYEISGFPQVSGTQMLFKTCGTGGGGGGGDFEMRRDTVFAQLEGNVAGSSGGFVATSYQQVYAMAQCEGDLSLGDCGQCVTQAVQHVEVECGGASSGQVYLDKCYISYSYYPHGVPHGGFGGQQTAKTVAIVLGGAVGLGFVVICLLFARSLVKKKDDY